MMKAPQEIIDLVARFDQNLEAYQSGRYNETQIRREFIDPFFKALGWDVENTSGYAEAYKDVIHEDAIKIGSANKAPDYSFRIGGTRKFFIEAKKPSVNIGEDIGPAYQLRRYAWSAKLPLSILTDFEEFAVYDCRIKPDKNDKASTARIIYLNYKDYSARWEEIASIFSKEAVMKGSFDKYAEASKAKRGTAGVDIAFLLEIDAWRQALAQNIALRNPKLTQREINFAVGKTIDRIIFLRICEDRGIEAYGKLMALQNGADVYQRLTKYFYDADDKYNSGLFHFRQEKDRSEPPDDLTLTLAIDDKILKDIFKSLYYPESPYEFSVLPADILGQVYEQFLGKVIYLTAGHRAKIEEKPEVRKAGGVYYTPTYIVDYIVKNTVGKLLEGKTPKAAEKLRILDPACGSGSFLIGAYQYLLDWHRDKYIEDGAEKHAKGKDPKLYQKIRNEWRLTTAERKRILLNNIYGVDIDPQAVEVTKLSLLLKVLEGESDETIKSAFQLFHERALPDLGNNIKCGNSLIGPDFYEGKQTSFLDTEEIQRVNAFDWEKEFPEIFQAGGFDAVIGNPPYGANLSNAEKEHIAAHFNCTQYKFDSFTFFIEKGIRLLRNDGYFGYIVPNTWLDTETFSRLRIFILHNTCLSQIVNLSKGVFTANIDTALLILTKPRLENNTIRIIDASDSKQNTQRISSPLRSFVIQQTLWENESDSKFNVYSDNHELALFKKIRGVSISLGEISESSQGLIPYNTKEMSAKNPYIGGKKLSKEWKPFLDQGACVSRYSDNWNGLYVKYGKWLYTANKPKYYENDKILIQRHRNPSLKRRIIATLDVSSYYFKDNLCCIIIREDQKYDLKYLLGVINSSMMNYFYKKNYTEVSLNPIYLRQLPIRKIDFNKSAEKKMHDQMVQLVEQMLSFNKQLAEAKTDHEKTLIQRQIDATDNQIDKLVYELYDLTPEEVNIIEGKL